MGFYQLNLSGTPIPFPTSTPVQGSYSPAELAGFLRYIVQPDDTLASIAAAYNVSAEDIMRANSMPDSTVYSGAQLVIPGVPRDMQIDGERGIVRVQMYEKPNGKQRTSYIFISAEDQSYYELQGNDLEPLQNVANRPIKIWGRLNIDNLDGPYAMPALEMEKFESLYPNLQFQILSGTQMMTEVNGAQIVLFTTGNTTYVQLDPSGGYPDGNYYDGADKVNLEVLQVPDESYAGYPAIRVFNSAPATNPINGEPIELNRSADTIEVMPDPYGNADSYILPNVTIDRVELVYFVSRPTYNRETMESLQTQKYIQPVWHFHGHDTNGDEIDILVQALQQEFLAPETVPLEGP